MEKGTFSISCTFYFDTENCSRPPADRSKSEFFFVLRFLSAADDSNLYKWIYGLHVIWRIWQLYNCYGLYILTVYSRETEKIFFLSGTSVFRSVFFSSCVLYEFRSWTIPASISPIEAQAARAEFLEPYGNERSIPILLLFKCCMFHWMIAKILVFEQRADELLSVILFSL